MKINTFYSLSKVYLLLILTIGLVSSFVEISLLGWNISWSMAQVACSVLGLIVVLSVLFVFNQYGGGGLNNHVWIYWTTIESTVWAIFLLGYLSVSRHYPVFINKGFVALGTVSYSIYLTHFIVLDFFMKYDFDY